MSTKLSSSKDWVTCERLGLLSCFLSAHIGYILDWAIICLECHLQKTYINVIF